MIKELHKLDSGADTPKMGMLQPCNGVVSYNCMLLHLTVIKVLRTTNIGFAAIGECCILSIFWST